MEGESTLRNLRKYMFDNAFTSFAWPAYIRLSGDGQSDGNILAVVEHSIKLLALPKKRIYHISDYHKVFMDCDDGILAPFINLNNWLSLPAKHARAESARVGN